MIEPPNLWLDYIEPEFRDRAPHCVRENGKDVFKCEGGVDLIQVGALSGAGVPNERLEREGGLQWPCATPDHPGTRFLYADSFPLGKAKFIPARQIETAAELPDREYPFVLNTGRLLYHWHGGTLTRRVEGLLELAPRLEVAVHPADARRLGVETGDRILVTSRRGELTGYARLTEAVHPGAIFVPFVKLADSAANFLTNSACDPVSKIPEYEVCAVKIEPVRTQERS